MKMKFLKKDELTEKDQKMVKFSEMMDAIKNHNNEKQGLLKDKSKYKTLFLTSLTINVILATGLGVALWLNYPY